MYLSERDQLSPPESNGLYMMFRCEDHSAEKLAESKSWRYGHHH
jgi:hypothetical protein